MDLFINAFKTKAVSGTTSSHSNLSAWIVFKKCIKEYFLCILELQLMLWSFHKTGRFCYHVMAAEISRPLQISLYCSLLNVKRQKKTKKNTDMSYYNKSSKP